jgi:hypothetical protein
MTINWSNPQRVGTYGDDDTDLIADLGGGLGNDILIGVTLIQTYHPMRPPGYPSRNSPGHALMPGMTVAAGATLWLLKPEADALVAVDAATYSGTPPPVLQVPQPLPVQAPAPYYAPVCAVAPSLSLGPAGIGDTATCSEGTWQNFPTDFAYQWSRYASADWSDLPIDGATAATYVTTEADDASYLWCTVTASNAAGSAQMFTSNYIWVTSTGAPPAKAASKRPQRRASPSQHRR